MQSDFLGIATFEQHFLYSHLVYSGSDVGTSLHKFLPTWAWVTFVCVCQPAPGAFQRGQVPLKPSPRAPVATERRKSSCDCIERNSVSS